MAEFVSLLLFVLLVVVGVAGLSIIVATVHWGISPMPTSPKVRRAMLSLVSAELTGELHELGAGWGGLALALARQCPNARVVAWEVSPVPAIVFWLRAKAARLPNLEVQLRDFRGADLRRATGIVCYLFTGGMKWLDETARRQRPGTELLIVTNTFTLHGWPEDKALTVDDLFRTKVTRYRRVPL
jgi:hypothetical protein